MGRAPDSVVEYSSVSTFCTFPPKEVGLYTKIMFVVDQSGSNANTDGSKQRRLDAMQGLYNKYANNQYVEWGFISFQDSGATAFISDPYFQPASAVPTAFDRFNATGDAGGTPYKSAIFEVTAAISDDLDRQTDQTEANYEIIFLSDGVPTDYGFPGPTDDQQIFDDIKRLIELAEGRIHFSTVYYNVSGTADPAAALRLEQMAEVGAGKFLDASNGGSIDLDGLIIGGVAKEPYQIKDFFVYNLNSALCEDGQLGSDTDTDGLCDRDEDYYNSRYRSLIDAKFSGQNFNKANRYSFSPIYSDLIMLKHILGEGLPTCELTESGEDSDADMLNNCEERFLVNRNPQGPTQSWTSEMLSRPKHTSSTNFDSDGDGIIDSLEFLFFKEKGVALDYNSIFRKIFGIYFYDLMKDHLSKLRPESSTPYRIDVRQIERNDKGENCYTFEQQNLPMYQVGNVAFSQTKNLDLVHGSDENVVLVYYIMVPENDPQGKGVMRYSYQKIQFSKGAPEKQLNLANDRFDHIFAR